MGRPSQVIVLAEDERHQHFIRRYLNRLHYSRHDIRFEDLPSGRGCGEQWVRERYGNAVRAYRSRSRRAKTALVVVIDADAEDVNQRSDQFRRALDQNGLDPRAASESIAHLIPKRNIETWILCLTGKDVDEGTDYRRERDIDRQILTAAGAFFDWSRPNFEPPEWCVPSLRLAISEVRRLE